MQQLIRCVKAAVGSSTGNTTGNSTKSEATLSGFNVSIVAGKDKQSSSANVEGSVQHVITDAERYTFGLDNSQLKDAVEKSFGKRPKDVFLRSPTPCGDLYRRYNWEQTSTVVTAICAEILEITSEPVALLTKTLTNNSSHEGTFTADLSRSVLDTVSLSWNVSSSPNDPGPG